MAHTHTTSLHGFGIESAKQPLTAVVSPESQDQVIGAILQFDGRGSLSPDGDSLTYTWEVEETPLGSTVSSVFATDEDGAVVTLVPDITGRYTVSLVVSTDYRVSSAVHGVVDVSALLTPYTQRTTPDGSIMFKLLSSFWRMVEGREAYSTLWSGYMQAAGSDLLRLFQVDYAKAISTIQPMFQRRWLSYSPSLNLDGQRCVAVYGNHQQGTGAFTVAGANASSGIIISATEIVLLDGKPTLSAAGSSLRVFSSGGTSNPGSYQISQLNADSSGYLVSRGGKFPAPADEILSASSDLVTFGGSVSVYSAAEDFYAAGVVAGDVLRLEDGADVGYYRIVGAGIADGLVNDRTLELQTAPVASRSGRSFTVFKALSIFAERAPQPLTNTVYIPEDDADLLELEAPARTGTGTIVGSHELVVEKRHVYPSLVGKSLRVTSGADGGRSFTTTGVNASETGYLVGSPFSAKSFLSEVSYEIPSTARASDRLLVLDGEAHIIVSASLDSIGVSSADGGYGPVWSVHLAEFSAPAGRTGLAWRIPATLTFDKTVDVEALGVTSGDLLVFGVTRADEARTAELPCHVVGARGSSLGFVIGAETPNTDEDGSLSDAEILALGTGLNIPRAYPNPANVGETLVVAAAAEIQTLLFSRAFGAAYYNVPLTPDTVIDLDLYGVTVAPLRIQRNCRIPVDETLVSVPSLFEYIAEPIYGELESGEYTLLTGGRSTVPLAREPIELLEGRDYSLSSADSVTGSNLQTVQDSPFVTVPYGDLIDRDVRVGDSLDIESGADQGRYIIQELLTGEVLRVSTALGAAPSRTATSLSYTIVRRVSGTFLRFVDGLFTANDPAPRSLWGQLSLFDNSQYIEDNFGVLVSVTKAQLDAYGTSQISYRGAVAALMYAWANGPSLRNVTIGTHILAGLPVVEVAGRILQIDEEYDSVNGLGRVLVEDTDPDGAGTGLVRMYYYVSTNDSDGLSEFAGLATNPQTGAAFALSDTVPAFTPLSRGIIVDDYISSPEWWRVGGAVGADELQKYHTWEVRVNAQEVASEDLTLIYDFCSAIKPVYTRPKVTYALYISDVVESTDSLSLALSLWFSDDPALSLEATHMVDAYNGSGLPLYALDIGTLSTRTPFEGRDLVTVDGSGIVTSDRGGFVGSLAGGTLPGVNSWFTGDVAYRGYSRVRPGDVLLISAGLNEGAYRVASVTDDNTLVIASLADWPPRTRAATDIEAATGQIFQVVRQVDADICSGTALMSRSYSAATDTTTIVVSSGNFRWEGAAIGDVLVISTAGADYGVHDILQVGYLAAGTPTDVDTTLVINGQLAGSGLTEYTVRRELLRQNPLVTGADGAVSSGGVQFVSAGSAFLLENIQLGDILACSSGPDANVEFNIIDVLDDNTIAVSEPFSGTGTGVEFTVYRPSLLGFDVPGADTDLEKAVAQDDVELVIVEPLTSVLALADFHMVAGAYTATSATDMAAAGVVPGMHLEIDNVHENTGGYGVVSVSATTVTVDSRWLATEGTVGGTFYFSAASWSVVGTTATISGISATLADLVIPGDLLEIDSVGTFVVQSTSGSTLTLTEDTGVGVATSYTGRVIRGAV